MGEKKKKTGLRVRYAGSSKKKKKERKRKGRIDSPQRRKK